MLYGMAQISSAGLDPIKVLGEGMGAAIITTFYGVILANLIFNPMAVKFETRIQKQNILQMMLIEGILLLQARKHPHSWKTQFLLTTAWLEEPWRD